MNSYLLRSVGRRSVWRFFSSSTTTYQSHSGRHDGRRVMRRGVAIGAAAIGASVTMFLAPTPNSLEDTEATKGPAVSLDLFRVVDKAHCDAAVNSNVRFQVLKGLEVKEEMERVRLAQLLHNLHKAATEEAGELAKTGRLRKYVTMFRTRSSTVTPAQQSAKAKTVEITKEGQLEVHGLDNLTPETAQKIIHSLRYDGKLTKEAFLSLISSARDLLAQEPTLIDLSGVSENITVVGDLHGSIHSLNCVLRLVEDKLGEPTDGKPGGVVVFDGDFVDRGHESLQVLSTLLLLKLAYPKHVVLLRGNHEDSLIASVYGFQDEVRSKYGSNTSDDIWKELGGLFAALPIAARTKNALIVHGGIPSMNFNLETLASVSSTERCKFPTVVPEDMNSETGKLLQNILWSDPDPDLGFEVVESPRGCGVYFGAKVAREFLERNDLTYLIRGHEPIDKGIQETHCGHGRSVVTVFSVAAYPNGEGDNIGGIVQLNGSGGFERLTFHDADGVAKRLSGSGGELRQLQSLIIGNKTKLAEAFHFMHGEDTLTVDQWVAVLADQLELEGIPWKNLQPDLAPLSPDGTIDWRNFLDRHSSRMEGSGIESSEMESLQANHKMLLTVFKFLDVDGNGSVDRDEFRQGLRLINKHLPDDQQLKNADVLFDKLDLDGNGSIDLHEFEEAFHVF